MNTLCEALESSQPAKMWDFQYPIVAALDFPSAQDASQAEREMRLQRAHEAALAAARQSGIQEGQRSAQAVWEQKVVAERQAIGRAVQKFEEERRQYFHAVESDVVTLALAIARKLLRREAQIDPLLLSGVVRVALDQIQTGSQVLLRCSPAELAAWQRFFEATPEIAVQPSITSDDTVEPGELVLETTAGRAAVSLEDNLKEIESGFFDLLHSQQGTPDEHTSVQLS